jgi:multiple sugar transport system substrate-binding protein
MADMLLRRRDFLHNAAVGAAGLAGILAFHQAPAYAQKRRLTMLIAEHFVPVSDENLRKWMAEFAKLHGIDGKIDSIAHRDTYVRLATEAETKSGHDLVFMFFNNPQLYAENLIDLDDVCERVGEKGGGWYQLARDVGMVGGHWKALPWYSITMPQTYREDLFQEVGEGPPDTWEDVLRAGKKLKAKGHLLGIAISQTEDANISWYALLWSYGTSTVDKDQKVIINSPETRKAVEYVKDLYASTMSSEVLSWDDASNNRAYMSGKYAWVHNAVSIYAMLPKNAPQLRAVTNHAPSPKGPAGRHATSIPINYGIWKFAKNQELAKEFLAYIAEEERLSINFEATEAYNHPLLKNFEKHPYWDKDPKISGLRLYLHDAHMIGWPGPPNRKAELVRAQWIVPNMMAKAVTGTPTDEAIKWAEAEIQKIYEAKD